MLLPMAASPPFLSSSSILNPNLHISSTYSIFHPSASSPLNFNPNKSLHAKRNLSPRNSAGAGEKWELPAFRGDFFLMDAIPVEESAQEIVAASGDASPSPVVGGLILVAFIGLSILTAGVVYIGVTDFLGKREREKFEKEESVKKKKKKGKIRSRFRSGPRGFGQKLIEEELDDLDL